VPNSLGPAELLLNYGTEEQKNHYLPRLAKGEEIPCFALTGPNAGSDAAALRDSGIVCRGEFDGKEVLGIRLNWNKRYITLAPVATVLGLAFRLHDPDHLLGDKENLGITCALIPTDLPGISIGRRHFPLNICFMNGPTQGKDVFVPLSFIIGGAQMAGQGWRMLMECLGEGRGISLPSGSVGGCKAATSLTGAYARIRKQFNVPIGYFEGIEEPLARMAGLTYINESALRFVASAVDQGAKPAVASAIVKYHTTENARIVTNAAMDIQGGKAICLGPRNNIGRGYQGVPIGITVEGANILTRSLIIFGQGAIRCHPYVIEELAAANDNDLARFDAALFSHLGYIGSNKLRTLFLALTGARFVRAPEGPAHRYCQLMTRYSSALAFMSEVAMLVLGANLKRREKLTARLGDALSMLYLGSAVIKRFVEDGQQEADLPLLDWSCRYLLAKTEDALYGVIRNFPNRFVTWTMLAVVFPLGRHLKPPTDNRGHQVAQILLAPSATRKRLLNGIDFAPSAHNHLAEMEAVLAQVIALEDVEKTISAAVKAGEIEDFADYAQRIQAAQAKSIITAKQAQAVQELEKARSNIIAVDDFAAEELERSK
jgi:acyl-CoA dehydrogenase